MFGLQWLRSGVVNGRMLHGVVRQGHGDVGGREQGRGDGRGKRAFACNPATVTSRNNQKKSSFEERSRSLPSSLGFTKTAATSFQ